MMHVEPFTASQLLQPPKVEVLPGVAVTLIAVPVPNVALQTGVFEAQLMPGGVLTTVPLPPPANCTVRSAPEPPPVLVKQITSASACAVTTAPEEERPVASWPVLTVAKTSAPPHTLPVAVIRPVEPIVNIWVLFTVQLT